MSNSKHAQLRYNFLDNCFRNKSYSFDELLKAVNDRIAEYYPGEGIADRTLREDLKVFRDNENGFGAPLPNKIRKLMYSDSKFSIAQRPLLESEQYLIEVTQQLLARFENHPKYDKLAEALIKFQDDEDQEEDLDKVLFYDVNEEYKGMKHLKPLYLAIKNKSVLSVNFKGFKDDKITTYEFHPYVLKQYNRRWFVFGNNTTANIKEWSIPLDERLIGYEVLEEKLYLESQTDWFVFFREMIGVVRPYNLKPETIVLKFHNGREQYFKTKPFQPDYDEYTDEAKRGQVFFNAIINKELVQQILSYGKDLEVLEPTILITQMKSHFDEMKEFYN